MERLDRISRILAGKRREMEALTAQERDIDGRLSRAEKTLAGWEEARDVLQQAAQAVQTAVHTRVTSVVNRCLEAVYDDPYTFHIVFEEKRGKTEARLFFTRDGNEVDPTEAAGLGVVDVASFALRVAVLKLHNPPVDQVMLLDEPFKWLDDEAILRVRDLILSLAEETGLQFIINTHDRELKVGKVVRISDFNAGRT